MNDIFSLKRGSSPLVISNPHSGAGLPGEIASRLSDAARPLPDTDWHVEKLYDFVDDLDATLITARLSRYVVDLNRPPDNETLYPGQNTTGLCPVITFREDPVYKDGQEPSPGEVATRRDLYWKPYHDALRRELDRVKAEHGVAYLYDCHSIPSQLPLLFTGTLPDLNLGTNKGKSCSAEIQQRVEAVLKSDDYTSVVNGRFFGGYITRHYGDPANNIHAIQMEIAQSTYMNEDPPWDYIPEKADKLKPVLRRTIEAMLG